jgi:CcmD family protein
MKALLVIVVMLAQQQAEMADVLRSNGKIYVVVTAVLIVLVGLFIYLFSIERKVKKLEQKIEDNR